MRIAPLYESRSNTFWRMYSAEVPFAQELALFQKLGVELRLDTRIAYIVSSIASVSAHCGPVVLAPPGYWFAGKSPSSRKSTDSNGGIA